MLGQSVWNALNHFLGIFFFFGNALLKCLKCIKPIYSDFYHQK